MYVTLRGTPGKRDVAAPTGKNGKKLGRTIAPTVIGLGTVSLLTDISSESVSAILPIYITVVMGFGPLAYGFVDGIYQGVSALVRIVGGWWADTSNRPKWVAFAGYALSALARIPLLITQGFWVITSTIAVDRIGKGIRTGPRDALIATASDPHHLGRNFGVHRTMDTIGALIGPLLAFAILAEFPFGLHGYQVVFVMSFAFAIVGVAVLALLIPDLRRTTATTSSTGISDSTDVSAVTDVVAVPARPRLADLARPGLRRLLIAAGLLSVFTVGDGFLYLALQDGSGISYKYFPLLFVGTNAAYLALAIPFGRVADRIGRAKVFIAGYVLLLAAYPLAASHWGGISGAVLVLLLLGSFYAATDGVLAALATREVPESVRASGISAAQTVVALVRFVSSIGFGLMWQLGNSTIALTVMAVGMTVSIPIAGWMLRGVGGGGSRMRQDAVSHATLAEPVE